MSPTYPAVALSSVKTYEPSLIDNHLQELWTSARMPDTRGLRVLVKPNILFDAPPERAVTTHPQVLASLLKLLLDQGARPVVGDSPAIHTSSFSGTVSGIRGVCDQFKVPWVDFLDPTVELTSSIGSRRKRTYQVTRHAAECDLIISVPKMKNHQLMITTGAVKNLFGVIPAFTKSPYHLRHANRREFAEFLCHLYSALPPVITVMDGILAMEGPGPNNGYPRHAGVLMASRDCGAVDVTAAAVMGYNPREIPGCIAMDRHGLSGAGDTSEITYPLEHPEKLQVKDFLQVKTQRKSRIIWDMIYPRIFRSFTSRSGGPVIRTERCISCGKCSLICPNGSARREDQVFAISLESCIRCYCCHEVCPADAIEITR